MMLPIHSHLKTRQVARALGVSPSTIKRWVDSGALAASRTLGKHRLISREDAERLARELGLSFDAEALRSDPDAPGGDLSTAISLLPPIGPDRVEALVSSLRRGRTAEVRDLIERTHVTEGPVVLADDLIRPAMVQLGHDWEVNGIDIFQEHRATRLVKLALFELVQKLADREDDPSAPLVLGASPEGDPYMLPGLLCELTLRWLGWNVMNLGVNLPLASLAKAVRAHRPALVWLSVSYLADMDGFVAEYPLFFQAATASGAAVILGGQALSAELRGQLLASSFGDRMSHLAEFARLLMRPEAAAPTHRPNRDTEP